MVAGTTYRVLREIGSGSYGKVWLVQNKRDTKKYVLKQIGLQNASKRERRAANLEAQLLATLRHPNIVSYRDSFETDDGFLFIAMGYCEGGDLHTRIKEQKGVPFDESQVVEWYIQICMALQHLHRRNILHRDLKTQNIFLTRTKRIKVGDLGIAKVLDGNAAMAMTMIGTPYYMSPEQFSSQPYNFKSDIWALGCCIYELVTLRHAFRAPDMASLRHKIVRGKVPTIPMQYSSELRGMIRNMLDHNPDRRPSVTTILGSAYITNNHALVMEGIRLRNKESNAAAPSVRSVRLVTSCNRKSQLSRKDTVELVIVGNRLNAEPRGLPRRVETIQSHVEEEDLQTPGSKPCPPPQAATPAEFAEGKPVPSSSRSKQPIDADDGNKEQIRKWLRLRLLKNLREDVPDDSSKVHTVLDSDGSLLSSVEQESQQNSLSKSDKENEVLREGGRPHRLWQNSGDFIADTKSRSASIRNATYRITRPQCPTTSSVRQSYLPPLKVTRPQGHRTAEESHLAEDNSCPRSRPVPSTPARHLLPPLLPNFVPSSEVVIHDHAEHSNEERIAKPFIRSGANLEARQRRRQKQLVELRADDDMRKCSDVPAHHTGEKDFCTRNGERIFTVKMSSSPLLKRSLQVSPTRRPLFA